MVKAIHANAEEQRDWFGTASLAGFGSASPGTLHERSNVDVLVRFAGTTAFEAYFGLTFYRDELRGER